MYSTHNIKGVCNWWTGLLDWITGVTFEHKFDHKKPSTNVDSVFTFGVT